MHSQNPEKIIITGTTGTDKLCNNLYRDFVELLSNIPELARYASDVLLQKRILKTFSGGEILAKPSETVGDHIVVIVMGLYEYKGTNIYQNYQEAKQLAWACKGGGAKKIIGIAPTMLHSKQEKKDAARDPLSLQLTLWELALAGYNRIIMVDPHTLAMESMVPSPLFDCRFQMLTARDIFANDIINNPLLDKEHLVIFSPDEGGAKRVRLARDVIKEMGSLQELIASNLFKDHPNNDAGLEIVDISAAKHILEKFKNGVDIALIDDFTITKGTIKKAAKSINDKLHPRSLIVYLTTLVPANSDVSSFDDAPYITEVVALDHTPIANLSSTIRTISASSELYAKALKCMIFGGSISQELFRGSTALK
ncbi:MAG: hypothetical protein ACD_58C00215G0002 [uncultured bacterium]|nr:MAG: hypothetical protein ACD_58C00215G0002 [uncultured bacterium]